MLWTIGVFALNFGPVIVGPILDYVGPKLTAILGAPFLRLRPSRWPHCSTSSGVLALSTAMAGMPEPAPLLHARGMVLSQGACISGCAPFAARGLLHWEDPEETWPACRAGTS